jgi:hypothetical protein
VCGLFGPVPKPPFVAPCERKPSAAVVPSKDKKEGQQRVLGQVEVLGRSDKGKAKLVFVSPTPKPILGKWIMGQSKLKGLGSSLSKKLGVDLKQAMGMGPHDDLVASTSVGVLIAISQP